VSHGKPPSSVEEGLRMSLRLVNRRARELLIENSRLTQEAMHNDQLRADLQAENARLRRRLEETQDALEVTRGAISSAYSGRVEAENRQVELEARMERLEAALRPFAEIADAYSQEAWRAGPSPMYAILDECRAARDALAAELNDPRHGEPVGVPEVAGLVIAFKALVARTGGSVEFGNAELEQAKQLHARVEADERRMVVELVHGPPPDVPRFAAEEPGGIPVASYYENMAREEVERLRGWIERWSHAEPMPEWFEQEVTDALAGEEPDVDVDCNAFSVEEPEK
jgi:hypothetical protein